MSENPEEWRPCHLNPEYAISDHGRVMRLGSRTSGRAGDIVTERISKLGYPRLVIRAERRARYVSTHLLVAGAFLGPKPFAKAQVNHKDGNKRNNHVSNLEYVTGLENMRHAYELGLIPHRQGSQLRQSRLTAEAVREIRARLKDGASYRTLSETYGVGRATIWNVAAGNTWAHVA